MSEADYRSLIADIESQIAASGYQDRARLRRHLAAVHDKAQDLGLKATHTGSRPEQDRIDDLVEAQFDNLPI